MQSRYSTWREESLTHRDRLHRTTSEVPYQGTGRPKVRWGTRGDRRDKSLPHSEELKTTSAYQWWSWKARKPHCEWHRTGGNCATSFWLPKLTRHTVWGLDGRGGHCHQSLSTQNVVMLSTGQCQETDSLPKYLLSIYLSRALQDYFINKNPNNYKAYTLPLSLGPKSTTPWVKKQTKPQFSQPSQSTVGETQWMSVQMSKFKTCNHETC